MESTDEEQQNPAQDAEDGVAGFEDMVALYDESMRNLTEGEIVTGEVIDITDDEVIVDVGYKSEGLIDRDEFTDREGELTVEVGDEVEVLLERTEDLEGHVVLSKQKAERMKIWTEIENSYKEGKIIKGKVVERIKGGLTVDIGIRAFLPGSLADIKPIKSLESLKGEEFEFKVISLDRRRNNVVLSRKAVLEKEFAKQKKETLTKLKEGALLPGVVKNITDYGVFVDLGGIDGLLHITDISWGRVNHPSEHFSVGDDVEVVILKFDPETERVSLGFKQKSEDPWTLVDKKYPLGSRVKGTVVSLVDYGAFVEIEEGVEGLIHVSEMSWTKRIKHPSEVLTKGDTVQARITHIDVENQRVSLSIKEFLPNEWQTFVNQHSVGEKVTGRVVNVTDFGLFVDIFEGLEGLAHVSEIDVAGDSLEEEFRVGDWVSARILRIEEDEKKVGLTMRGVHQPTEEEAAELQAEWEKDQAPDEEGEEGDEERDSDSDPDAEVGGGEGPSDEDEEVDAGEAESDEDEGDDEEGDDEDEGDGDEGDAEDEDEDEDDDEDDDEEGDAEDEGDGGDEDDVEDEGDDEEGDVEDEDEEGDVEDEDDGDEGDEEEDDEDDGEEDEEDEDEEKEGDGSEELEESADEDAEGADESDDEERSE